jgi:CBS domain-containing protein
MNILFFLKPKADIAYVIDNFTLRQALEKMRHYGYTTIPVLNKAGEYVGTVSEGDLLWSILDLKAYDDKDREQYFVKDILKGRYHSPVNVNALIEDLLLTAMNQNFVPVTDDRGLFIGIVTRKDIMQYYYDMTHNAETKEGQEFPDGQEAENG